MRLRPELTSQVFPPGHATGHAPRQQSIRRNVSQPLLCEYFACEGIRTSSAAIQPIEFLRPGVPIDDKDVATNAAAHGLDKPHHGAGGDRGVSGIAAALQYFNTHLSSQRLA